MQALTSLENSVTLRNLARRYRENGDTARECRSKIQADNKGLDEHELSERELEEIIEDVFKEEISSRIVACGNKTGSDELSKPSILPEAFQGFSGEIVQAIAPQTEADAAAILVQLLCSFGNCIGSRPHFLVEADRHGLNLFVVLVGPTSFGRKGTALSHVLRLFKGIDPEEWDEKCTISGLASGEGLIWRIRDPITEENTTLRQNETGKKCSAGIGIAEKRLLVIETEFGSVLRIIERRGCTLSPIIRDAWDGKTLQNISKGNPARASNPHISIIGHITQEEVIRYLNRIEIGNGFANRFIWIAAFRSKVLPFGGRLDPEVLGQLKEKLSDRLAFARAQDEIGLDEEAIELWKRIYSELTDSSPGLTGALINRAAPQVRRLACIYALLDRSPLVLARHLKAALALWDYSKCSCFSIFGTLTGNKAADLIYKYLVNAGSAGMTRTEISQKVFHGNQEAKFIDRALNALSVLGLAGCTVESQKAGRNSERWCILKR